MTETFGDSESTEFILLFKLNSFFLFCMTFWLKIGSSIRNSKRSSVLNDLGSFRNPSLFSVFSSILFELDSSLSVLSLSLKLPSGCGTNS